LRSSANGFRDCLRDAHIDTASGTGKRIGEKGHKPMKRLSRNVFVETDVDTVVFPPRPNMRRPLVDLLRAGPLSSQTIEDALANDFA
jgi:hypothetical protein